MITKIEKKYNVKCNWCESWLEYEIDDITCVIVDSKHGKQFIKCSECGREVLVGY